MTVWPSCSATKSFTFDGGAFSNRFPPMKWAGNLCFSAYEGLPFEVVPLGALCPLGSAILYLKRDLRMRNNKMLFSYFSCRTLRERRSGGRASRHCCRVAPRECLSPGWACKIGARSVCWKHCYQDDPKSAGCLVVTKMFSGKIENQPRFAAEFLSLGERWSPTSQNLRWISAQVSLQGSLRGGERLDGGLEKGLADKGTKSRSRRSESRLVERPAVSVRRPGELRSSREGREEKEIRVWARTGRSRLDEWQSKSFWWEPAPMRRWKVEPAQHAKGTACIQCRGSDLWFAICTRYLLLVIHFTPPPPLQHFPGSLEMCCILLQKRGLVADVPSSPPSLSSTECWEARAGLEKPKGLRLRCHTQCVRRHQVQVLAPGG